MAADRGLGSIGVAIARTAARQQRLVNQAARKVAEDARLETAALFRRELRAAREAIRNRIVPGARRLEDTREEKELYLRERQHETAELNERLKRCWKELDALIPDALAGSVAIGFDDLRLRGEPPIPEPPEGLLTPAKRPILAVPPPQLERARGLAALVSGGRTRPAEPPAAEMERARLAHQAASAEWSERERRRLESLTAWEIAQESQRQSFLMKQLLRDREIDAVLDAYADGDPDAIVALVSMALEHSLYPAGFPQNFEVAFDEETGQLVVEYEMPGPEIVPEDLELQYIQSSNKITPIPARKMDRQFVHQAVIGAIALRSLHEIVRLDLSSAVAWIGFNGYVRRDARRDDATSRSYLVSILTTPGEFRRLDLSELDWRAALRALGASMSRRQDDDPSIEPLVDFCWTNGRQTGTQASFDLANLDAASLERHVTELFGRLGYHSLRSRSSDLGDVELVGFDDHPLLGGKVMIVLRRDATAMDPKPVAAFLELMAAEGAEKGFLLTTGGFSLEALSAALEKPVELIDGHGLKPLMTREFGPRVTALSER